MFFYILFAKGENMRIPRYAMPTYPRFALGSDKVHTLKIVDFLRYVVERDQLSINEYLLAMGQDPFFLVAATGLGKTVAVPIHVFIRQMQSIGKSPDPQPRVWVVEPRIPIAVDQMKFMNSLWQEYLRAKGEKPLPPLFGCISSSSGNVNRDAPIKFVTTGIFEVMAKSCELAPTRDRVIIDEAHVTIEQSPGVELGISLARRAGVIVDYMSATVDTSTLQQDLGIQNIVRADKQRHAIWKHNLLQPLDKALPELVQNTLVSPATGSSYFPQPGEFRLAEEITSAVTEPNRSHGLLAVVNSFAGEQSDIRRLADILRKHFPELPVLLMASEVVRDAKREQEFQRQLRSIEAAKQNYVILATSVVEMGITFPTLDFIVTMDCGYDQETIGDTSFPVIAPLGVNSLLQRFGRVGRRRHGIAYISREVGADYSELEDAELNGKLSYEPIRFPMANAPLMPLAYYACSQERGDLGQWVASLNLPSKLHKDSDRMAFLQEQITMLQSLGLAFEGKLTPLGRRMEPWVGRADLAYAAKMQVRFEESCDLPELMFWIVATALSNVPIVALRAPHTYFVDFNGSHAEIAHEIDVWSGYYHEDLTTFSVVSRLASMWPKAMFDSKTLNGWDRSEFDRWCNVAGVDGRKMLNAGSAIADLWKLFCRVNCKSERFNVLFGNQNQPNLAHLSWATFVSQISATQIHDDLAQMPGVERLVIVGDLTDSLKWYAGIHGGILIKDDTPVPMLTDRQYFARLVPRRETKDGEVSWQLTHLGMNLAPATEPTQVIQPEAAEVPTKATTEKQPKTFLGRLLRFLGLEDYI